MRMKRVGRLVLWLLAVVGLISVVGFVKDEVRSGRSGPSAAQRAADARECRAVAQKAEEGTIYLPPGNGYLRCLRPGVDQKALLRKYELHNAEADRATARERGEAEARENQMQREQEGARTQAEQRGGAP